MSIVGPTDPGIDYRWSKEYQREASWKFAGALLGYALLLSPIPLIGQTRHISFARGIFKGYTREGTEGIIKFVSKKPIRTTLMVSSAGGGTVALNQTAMLAKEITLIMITNYETVTPLMRRRLLNVLEIEGEQEKYDALMALYDAYKQSQGGQGVDLPAIPEAASPLDGLKTLKPISGLGKGPPLGPLDGGPIPDYTSRRIKAPTRKRGKRRMTRRGQNVPPWWI